MGRRCNCGKEYDTAGMCPHCDAVPRCVIKGTSCQWCLNAAHVCPICKTVRDHPDDARRCEKRDRTTEIKQARESTP